MTGYNIRSGELARAVIQTKGAGLTAKMPELDLADETARAKRVRLIH